MRPCRVHGEGRDELVGDAGVVEVFDAADGVRVGASLGGAGDHGIERLTLLFPAEVTVHGEVAAGDAGDPADADGFELLPEGFEVAEAGGGHGVAAVHEGVDEDAGEALAGGEAEEGVEVAGVGVDAAVRQEADEVKRPASLPCEVHGSEEGGVGEEGAVGDSGVDAGHVHADDPAGAEVEVADLGVAHLAVREADEVVASAKEGVGEVAEELVVDGFAGLCDGVAVGLGAVAPAVEDGEDDGFGHALRG